MVKNPPANTDRCKRYGFDSWIGKISRRGAQQPTPVFFPGESHGQRSLVGYGPCSHKELDTTEQLNTCLCNIKTDVLKLKPLVNLTGTLMSA